jgi:hypothetical protein
MLLGEKSGPPSRGKALAAPLKAAPNASRSKFLPYSIRGKKTEKPQKGI